MRYFAACLFSFVSIGATEFYTYENQEYQTEDQETAEDTAEEYVHRRCRYHHKRWRENPYTQRDSQDVSWAARRDDELSDQLSR